MISIILKNDKHYITACVQVRVKMSGRKPAHRNIAVRLRDLSFCDLDGNSNQQTLRIPLRSCIFVARGAIFFFERVTYKQLRTRYIRNTSFQFPICKNRHVACQMFWYICRLKKGKKRTNEKNLSIVYIQGVLEILTLILMTRSERF